MRAVLQPRNERTDKCMQMYVRLDRRNKALADPAEGPVLRAVVATSPERPGPASYLAVGFGSPLIREPVAQAEKMLRELAPPAPRGR